MTCTAVTNIHPHRGTLFHLTFYSIGAILLVDNNTQHKELYATRATKVHRSACYRGRHICQPRCLECTMKRYRDVLGMQLGMLERVLDSEHHANQRVYTRIDPARTCTDPKTGKTYRIVK